MSKETGKEDKEICSQHAETCSDPYCEKHN